MLNINGVLEINAWSNIQGADLTLGKSLFGTAKFTENFGPDACKYFSYGVRFYARGNFKFSNGSGFEKKCCVICCWCKLGGTYW